MQALTEIFLLVLPIIIFCLLSDFYYNGLCFYPILVFKVYISLFFLLLFSYSTDISCYRITQTSEKINICSRNSLRVSKQSCTQWKPHLGSSKSFVHLMIVILNTSTLLTFQQSFWPFFSFQGIPSSKTISSYDLWPFILAQLNS